MSRVRADRRMVFMMDLLRLWGESGSITFTLRSAQIGRGVLAVGANRKLSLVAPAVAAGVEVLRWVGREGLEQEIFFGAQVAAERRLLNDSIVGRAVCYIRH